MANKKCIHDGHRERLWKLVYDVGLDKVSEVQAVECFLTYIFPRGDVNPLAHRLIDRYGDFQHILESSVADLVKVEGIGETSAMKILEFKEFFFLFTTNKMRKKIKVTCKAELIDIIEDCLRFRETEHMIVLALSASNIIIASRVFKTNKANQVEINPIELADFISMAKPTSLVIGHCHPYGRALPSSGDDVGFERVRRICNDLGVSLIDSFILGEDGVYSQKDEQMLRTYYDVDELTMALKNVSSN